MKRRNFLLLLFLLLFSFLLGNQLIERDLLNGMTADSAVNIINFPRKNSETNDTARLQRAVNQCVTGSILWIPHGTNLTVEGTIKIPVSITITGGGTISYQSDDARGETVLFDFNRQAATQKDIMYDIKIENITIIGNVLDNSRENPQIFIRTWFSQGIIIRNCKFKNTNIAFRPQNTKDILIEKNQFSDLHETFYDRINGYGVMLETTENVKILNNIFDRVERHSIYLNHFSNATVLGNVFKGNPNYVARTGYELPIKLTDGSDFVISDNQFKDTVGGISLMRFSPSTTTPLENGVISNNIFDHYTKNDSIVTGFIYLHNPYLKNIKIHHNTFKDAYNHFIYYRGGGDVEIYNNTFEGGQQGIRIESDSPDAYLRIDNNSFENLSVGVNCTNARTKVFVNNNQYKSVTNSVNCILVAVSDYSDLKVSHWALDEIMYLADGQIIGGYPNGSFQPEKKTTRAEAAKMLALALELPVKETPSGYKDVSSKHWAKNYIAAVSKAGLFNGNPDGTFEPDDMLTRAEMAKVISIAYGLKVSNADHFKDVKKTHWAKSYISGLYENGITTGYPDKTFHPEEPTTRAEYSVFLARALNEDFR